MVFFMQSIVKAWAWHKEYSVVAPTTGLDFC